MGKKTIDFITQHDALQERKAMGGLKSKAPQLYTLLITDQHPQPFIGSVQPCQDSHIPLLHLKSALLSLISAQLGQKSDLSGFETVLKRYSKHHRPSTCYLRPHKIFEVRQIKVPSVL